MTQQTLRSLRPLSRRQLDLLRFLQPYRSVRHGTGLIERQLPLMGDIFMPSTFNSLVDRGFAWGVDHTYGPIRVGRLRAGDDYLLTLKKDTQNGAQ